MIFTESKRQGQSVKQQEYSKRRFCLGFGQILLFPPFWLKCWVHSVETMERRGPRSLGHSADVEGPIHLLRPDTELLHCPLSLRLPWSLLGTKQVRHFLPSDHLQGEACRLRCGHRGRGPRTADPSVTGPVGRACGSSTSDKFWIWKRFLCCWVSQGSFAEGLACILNPGPLSPPTEFALSKNLKSGRKVARA